MVQFGFGIISLRRSEQLPLKPHSVVVSLDALSDKEFSDLKFYFALVFCYDFAQVRKPRFYFLQDKAFSERSLYLLEKLFEWKPLE